VAKTGPTEGTEEGNSEADETASGTKHKHRLDLLYFRQRELSLALTTVQAERSNLFIYGQPLLTIYSGNITTLLFLDAVRNSSVTYPLILPHEIQGIT